MWTTSGSRSWDAPNKHIFSWSWKWCKALEIHLLKNTEQQSSTLMVKLHLMVELHFCNRTRVCNAIFLKMEVMWGQKGKEEPEHIGDFMQILTPIDKVNSKAPCGFSGPQMYIWTFAGLAGPNQSSWVSVMIHLAKAAVKSIQQLKWDVAKISLASNCYTGAAFQKHPQLQLVRIGSYCCSLGDEKRGSLTGETWRKQF